MSVVGETSPVRLQIRSFTPTTILFIPVNEKKKISEPYKKIKWFILVCKALYPINSDFSISACILVAIGYR